LNYILIEIFFFTVNIGAFAFGISLGWSAPLAPKVLDPNFDFRLSENEFSLIVSALDLGAIFVQFFCGFIRNKFGTKKTILLFGLADLTGWLLIIFAQNPLMVIL
jgi:SP family facilitated glucose transporter-like MFS transporter 8